MAVTFVGFDSAWTDNSKAPGAICSIVHDRDHFSDFTTPFLVSFDDALDYVRSIHAPGHLTVVAIDQPTIVPNRSGMRPAERVAASVVSWLGGGVQPANRSRVGMFDDSAPIWKFLTRLGATDDPEGARMADAGLYVMEVFPALALAAFSDALCGRLRGARYNPSRRKSFRRDDWDKVVAVVAADALAVGCGDFDTWCTTVKEIGAPRKSDQDKLDAAVCLLAAIRWMQWPRKYSIMIGDLATGYITSPVSSQIRQRLEVKAKLLSVALDGVIPS